MGRMEIVIVAALSLQLSLGRAALLPEAHDLLSAVSLNLSSDTLHTALELS